MRLRLRCWPPGNDAPRRAGSERAGGKHKVEQDRLDAAGEVMEDDMEGRVCAQGHITLAWTAELYRCDLQAERSSARMANLYSLAMALQ